MSVVLDLSNLPSAVNFALDSVSKCLHDKVVSPLESRDLEVALNALVVIKQELESGELRPKGLRSAAFTRYAIDESSNLEISEGIRKLIVRIEELYKKY